MLLVFLVFLNSFEKCYEEKNGSNLLPETSFEIENLCIFSDVKIVFRVSDIKINRIIVKSLLSEYYIK